MSQEKLQTYIDSKLATNGGGRPHFVKELVNQKKDPKEELLNILEEVWLRNRSLYTLAKKYNTGYHTLYRVLQDLEPLKQEFCTYINEHPRRKRFFIEDLETSDCETVQTYINYAKREGLIHWRRNIKQAQKCWTSLNYRDPSTWTADEITDFLRTQVNGDTMRARVLDSIRQVAPQTKQSSSQDYVKTGKYREKVGSPKIDIFSNEYNMIRQALKDRGLNYELTILDFHVTGAFREGSTNSKSGIIGISWDRFHKDFARVDDWESKIRGGIWCRDCPVDLFFKDLPARLRALWEERGKPSDAKLLLGGYKELISIYKTIRMVLKDYYTGKVTPDLLKEFAKITPHFADKIHCNLCWEAEIPMEVVAGQFLGRGESIGLVGRIWIDTDTIKKHYLSLTQRSDRFKKLMDQVDNYSKRFEPPQPQEATQPVQEVIA